MEQSALLAATVLKCQSSKDLVIKLSGERDQLQHQLHEATVDKEGAVNLLSVSMQDMAVQCGQMIRNMASVAAQAGPASGILTKTLEMVVHSKELGVNQDACDAAVLGMHDSCTVDQPSVLTPGLERPKNVGIPPAVECAEYQPFVPSSAPK